MNIRKVNLGVLFFTVAFYVMASGALVLRANPSLDLANQALSAGKYKQVIKTVSKLVASKAPADVIAKGLLFRGIAYRNQGKIAQSIADFSNAEWVRKLKGSDLRRLYAERALAYDAVGQKALAAKDRKLAGSNNVKLAQQASVKNGISLSNNNVRQTSVEAKKSTTDELFGGLKNLFGFNSQPQQKIVVTKPKTQTGALAVNDGSAIREIPTLDSAEAKSTAKKLQTAALPPKVQVKKEVVTNSVPSNSAWAAQRADEIKANKRTVNKKIQSADDLTTSSPIKLAPKKVKEPDNSNVVGNFINNIFGGAPKKEAPPVRPGDDVIVAEQVITPPVQNKKSVKKAALTKKKIRSKIKKALRKTKVASVASAKKKTSAATASRSLYHVQLGAFGESAAADKFVNRLNSKYKSLVGNKTAMVVETDLGQQRRQYRVFLGPYRSRDKGKKTCNVLTRLGMGCSIVE